MGIQGYTPQCHPHQGNRVLLGDYSGTMMLNTPWTRPYFRGDTLMYIPIMVSCKRTKNSPGCGCLGYIGDRLLLLLGFWNCPLCHSRFSWLVVRVGVCNSRHIDSKCLVVGDIMCQFKFPSKISRQHFNTTNLVTNQALAGWFFFCCLTDQARHCCMSSCHSEQFSKVFKDLLQPLGQIVGLWKKIPWTSLIFPFSSYRNLGRVSQNYTTRKIICFFRILALTSPYKSPLRFWNTSSIVVLWAVFE